ncbi:MAG: ribonuclease HII, partial [Bacteroidetes bacterium]|nr:ribonuclease HII [Bacteroidota bacterium]
MDEAGRGPLAGPVVAAAVVFPRGWVIEGVRDSKQLTPSRLEVLYREILAQAVAYGIGVIDNEEIDRVNILQATRRAMYQAVQALGGSTDFLLPDFLLIDAL